MMFRKETEFQETEIGMLPEGWRIKRLSEVAIIRSGFSERRRDERSRVIHLRPDNINNETDKIIFNNIVYIPESSKIEKYLLEHLDIVLVNTNGSINHIGKVGIIDFSLDKKITFSNHLTAIRIVSKDINPYYVYYFLSLLHLKGYYKKLVKNQAGKWNLNLSTIRDLLIPIPPLEEQKRIADILSMIDSGIETVDRAIAKLERMKRALLNELLTGRIRVREVNGKLTFYKEIEFQETEIGEMPKDWKIEKLKNIVIKAKMGGTPKSTVHEYWGGDIPFARVEDITSSHKYLFKTSTTITKLGLENSNAWIVPKDSLLITIYGTLGAVAINKIELATNQAIVSIIPRKDIVDVEYLYYWYSFFQTNWNKYVKKSTQPNLTLEIVTNSKLPLPSIKEQKRIVDILSTIDSTIELYYREKEKLLRLRRGLMGVLLTGRVRVVSDVRDVEVVI